MGGTRMTYAYAYENGRMMAIDISVCMVSPLTNKELDFVDVHVTTFSSSPCTIRQDDLELGHCSMHADELHPQRRCLEARLTSSEGEMAADGK